MLRRLGRGRAEFANVVKQVRALDDWTGEVLGGIGMPDVGRCGPLNWSLDES